MAYIVSHNIISSLGFGTEENFRKIQSGSTGISLSEPDISPEVSSLAKVDTKNLKTLFSKIESEEEEYTRYEKLLICSIYDALKNTDIDLQSADTVFVFSTTKGNVNLREKQYIGRYKEERLHLWKSSEIVTRFFNNSVKPITISNACISGSLALIVAQRLIRRGSYKHAVVVGADILSAFTFSGFQAFKAVSPQTCKPFDADREGMTPGEGAGTIILSGDIPKSDEIKIAISGGSSGNDANHISGPSRTGEELARVIHSAMNEAELNAADIDYISAHGTATPYNDEMESKAFGICGLQSVPVNSYKGNIGHTFGAAGIIETILAAECIKRQILLPSFGFQNQGTSQKLNVIKKPQKAVIHTALKTASGFGGSNAALIISKAHVPKNKFQNTELSVKQSVIVDNFHVIKINGTKQSFDFHESPDRTINSEADYQKFSKQLYKELKCNYPKFYKMDKLCRLAFIGSELLLYKSGIEKYKPDDVALVISNGSASSETDAEYQKTIDDADNYFPSPKVFVYTLANIMLGEIAIRNNFKGENALFAESEFDKEFIFDYSKKLLAEQKAKAVIAGRVDYNSSKSRRYVELYLLESSKTLQ